MAHIYVSPMSSQMYDNPLYDRRIKPEYKRPREITHIFKGLYTKIGKTSGDCKSRNYNGSHFSAFAIGEEDVIAIKNKGRDNINTDDDLFSRYLLNSYDDLLLNLEAWEIKIDPNLMDSIEKLSQYLARERYGLAVSTFKELDKETNEWQLVLYSGYTETFNCTVMQGRQCVLDAIEIAQQGLKKLAA